MIKGRKLICDKCGKPRGDRGAIISVDKPGDIEWIDLCGKCWREFKEFLGREEAE
jgi:hypothetical protein